MRKELFNLFVRLLHKNGILFVSLLASVLLAELLRNAINRVWATKTFNYSGNECRLSIIYYKINAFDYCLAFIGNI